MNFEKSFSLLDKARKLIPSITQTFSKGPYTFVEGQFPVYIEKAKGSHIFDVDGNEFIDYLCGLGPVVLGYKYDSVDTAIKEQLENGITFSLPHILEIETSELLCKIIPSAEMVKFSKTGSGAATGAVRAARAITKKNKIAYCGTGGVWHDWYASIISKNQGVPSFNKDLIIPFDYNDIDGLKTIFENNQDEIACVFMEPTLYEQPINSFLQQVRKIANENNSVLIFDEIVTAFRFSNGGAQDYFGVKPDLTVLGKGMANGMPLSAVVGKTEFMKIFDDIFFSTTYAGETLSLAASKATINEFIDKPVVSKMWDNGKKLSVGFNKIAKENSIDLELSGYHVRMKLTSKEMNESTSLLVRSLFVQEMVKNGIFMHPTIGFTNFSHENEDIDKTIQCFVSSLDIVKKALTENKLNSYLKGKPAKIVYKILKPSEKKKH